MITKRDAQSLCEFSKPKVAIDDEMEVRIARQVADISTKIEVASREGRHLITVPLTEIYGGAMPESDDDPKLESTGECVRFILRYVREAGFTVFPDPNGGIVISWIL